MMKPKGTTEPVLGSRHSPASATFLGWGSINSLPPAGGCPGLSAMYLLPLHTQEEPSQSHGSSHSSAAFSPSRSLCSHRGPGECARTPRAEQVAATPALL